MTAIDWQEPYLAEGSYYLIAHNVDRAAFERLKTHPVFGRIVPFYNGATGFMSGCLTAVTKADADYCMRWLDAEFPPYGVVALNDYLESVIVDALLAGLLDDSDDCADGWAA